MTSRATETTTSVHQRRSWMLWAVAAMVSPPRITIRYGLVSLLKHSRADLCNAYVANLCGVGHSGALRGSRSRRGTWRAHIGEAREYAAKRAGHVSFGVRTQRGIRGAEIRRPVPSASVVKAKLLVAYLRQPNVRHRRLRRDERALLGPMIRRSDNAAASQVCNILGYPIRPWGLTPIDVAGQTRFFLHIDRGSRGATVATPCACWLDHPFAALGHRASPPARLGALLQGWMGLRDRMGRPPGGAAAPRSPPALGGDPDHLEPKPRVRQRDAARRGGAPAARARAALPAALSDAVNGLH